MRGTGTKTVYDTLVELKPPEMSFAAWAKKAGVSRSIFTEIESHDNPRQATLDKLLDAIGVSRVAFDAARYPIVRTEVAGTGIGDVRREFFGPEPLPPLPLVGSATGGEHNDIDEEIELTELHLAEVLDYIARPTSLAGDREAYALTIMGNSMAPRFKQGERVVVAPRAMIGVGDDVIVQLRGPDGEDERIKTVLIKELVRRSASTVTLRQYNPARDFTIDRRRIAAMHKVQGNFF